MSAVETNLPKPPGPAGRFFMPRRRAARLFLLNRQLTLFAFSPQLIVSRERQTSNSELHNDRRSRADLRFVRQF